VAYDILTQTQWAGTALTDLISAVLKPHRPGNGQIVIDGPAVLLPGPAMVPLSMTLHKLTTNAIKYGALSTSTGRIEIAWKLIGGVGQSVELIWRESGGPTVECGASSGFGTSLIDRFVSSDLRGTVHIDFDSAGICCTVRFPLRGE
jgi:two-component system, chemotaxis family, CheB/CheR fusion protein